MASTRGSFSVVRPQVCTSGFTGTSTPNVHTNSFVELQIVPVRHMQSYAHIVRDESGWGTRIVGATSDITNEVQTTQLLQLKAVPPKKTVAGVPAKVVGEAGCSEPSRNMDQVIGADI